MAADINSVVMVGRLTRDAELRYAQTGTAIVKFSLAQTHRRKSGDTWSDESHFFDVTMMGKAAEAVHRFLTKGKQVAIQGELRQNRWEQDGQSRSKVEIFAFSLQLLGGGSGGQGSGFNQGGNSYDSNQGNNSSGYDGYTNSGSGGFDDDVPF
ncbi:single-stranded DNA-binding protein [Spirochaeta lutea]|uniref:Single-stranded DNA-binding protein n=1 Tax=Spirochaeta lutea TaxID=1480694 RepID=A0A098R1J5_9SPIO|nr:single-stranded DNA-binding protein [Spirochaeta lutea]KGE73804.1 single-stranded DNA-binding protein [Spirochaeta lutea]